MSNEAQEYEYSDDEILDKAIELIKKGSTEEEARRKFRLSEDDMDLIDFVINEL
ncbi:hypothetical protein [Niallia sp. Krafla_26]|uniref:hypothetical protein n=1 Tax=Niallia sp. Krafla_26 TaxID=3064703 RepID=UPI003D1843B1